MLSKSTHLRLGYVSNLLRRDVEVVHYAVVRHDCESFVFVIEGDRLQFVVYFDLAQAQIVVKELGHRLQEAEPAHSYKP